MDQLTGQSQAPLFPGLVVAAHGATVEVEGADGARRICLVPRRHGLVVVGDRVTWMLEGDQGVIAGREPRTTLLARHDVDGSQRPLAANVDRILVVAAPLPVYSTELIDRYLVAAEATGIRPAVVLTKVDLLNPEERRAAERALEVYRTIGYDLLLSSSREAHGLDTLNAALRGQTSVFVGQSGAGKSSLVAALVPEAEVRIGAISTATGLGRHTTSASRLYHLPDGGAIIDSPGVRDFRLWCLAPETVANGFREFQPYLGRCRFRDCRHEGEPGCAIEAAVAAGTIAPPRLESYRRIVAENERLPALDY